MLQLHPKASAHYEKQITIPDYQCDIHGEMKLSSVLKQIQRVSNQHLEEMGFSYQDLWKENIVFLLARMALRCHRSPRSEEEIKIKTNPQINKGAQLLRRIEFWSQKGELLLEAQSSWLMVNPVTRKILRPSAFPFEIPGDSSNYEPSLDEIKTKCPKDLAEISQGEKMVQYSDLDCNYHLNNTVYADMVCNLLPYEEMEKKRWQEFAIHYRKEAVMGDAISLGLFRQGEYRYYIQGNKGETSCFEASILLGEPKEII